MAVTFRKLGDPEVPVVQAPTQDGRLLSVAKKNYLEDMKKGTTCPCCGRYGKLHRVSLSRTMVLSLNWIAKEGKGNPHGWANVQEQAPRSILRARSYMKLIHWGLIQRRPSAVGDGPGSAGFWRVTNEGLRFLYGDVAVPKYAFLYNRKCQSLGGPHIFAMRVLQAGDLEELITR